MEKPNFNKIVTADVAESSSEDEQLKTPNKLVPGHRPKNSIGENVDSDDEQGEVQDSIIWKPLGGVEREDAFNLSGKIRRGTLNPEQIAKIKKKKTYLVQFDDQVMNIDDALSNDSGSVHIHANYHNHAHGHDHEHKKKADRKRKTRELKDNNRTSDMLK